MLLADTSVWIEHLRVGVPRLAAALDAGIVAAHPFVVGELACGTLRDRRGILADLALLPQVEVAQHAEVLALVERRALAGRGIGWIDAHLLAAALISGSALWTLDRRLDELWRAAGGR